MEEMDQIGTENAQVQSSNPLKSYLSFIVIIGSLVMGYMIYFLVMGNPDNFADGEIRHTPVDEGFGKWLGLFYLGGMFIGLAVALFIITLTLTIERIITLSKAGGRGRMDVFVQKVQVKLEDDDIDGAIEECDRQRGTVGNVVKEALKKYKWAANNPDIEFERRKLMIQKSIEEATALELPMLERHLPIIATIVSIATLVGLIGTVVGMIKAFQALGSGGGSPDVAALSIGISEALMNTATGISTSTIATVAYNYFTNQIDGMTYRIDEAGISIVETFEEKYR